VTVNGKLAGVPPEVLSGTFESSGRRGGRRQAGDKATPHQGTREWSTRRLGRIAKAGKALG